MIRLLLVGCVAALCFAQVDAKLSLGRDACRQVTVPGAEWTPANRDADPTVGYQLREELAFRTPTGGTELYFAAVTSPRYLDLFGPYSRQEFAIGIHDSAPPREIKTEDWSGARPLTRVVTRAAGNQEIGENDNHDLSYGGRQFAKSGEHLALADASDDDRWLAVFSYDGKQGVDVPGTIGGGFRSRHPDRGTLLCRCLQRCNGRQGNCTQRAF